MAGNITGNVVTGSEIVYLKPTGDYARPSPFTTVADGSGNYTFTAVPDGIYDVYTPKSYPSKRRVIIAGANAVDVNLSA